MPKLNPFERAMVSPQASEFAARQRWGPGSAPNRHGSENPLRTGDRVTRYGMPGVFIVASDPFKDGNRTYVYLKRRAGKGRLKHFAGCAPVSTLDRID